MRRDGFTLVEVMVAVMLFFVVSLVAFNISSNVKRLFLNLKEKERFVIFSSVVFVEQKDTKNLYEQLSDFKISNDRIIKVLKSKELKLQKSMEYNNDINSSGFNAALTLYKLKVYDKNFANYAYEVELK